MTTFVPTLHEIGRRIDDTAVLPTGEQPEALIALFQSIPRAEVAPFVALLIGEVVARRPHRPPARSIPQPSPAAASASA